MNTLASPAIRTAEQQSAPEHYVYNVPDAYEQDPEILRAEMLFLNNPQSEAIAGEVYYALKNVQGECQMDYQKFCGESYVSFGDAQSQLESIFSMTLPFLMSRRLSKSSERIPQHNSGRKLIEYLRSYYIPKNTVKAPKEAVPSASFARPTGGSLLGNDKKLAGVQGVKSHVMRNNEKDHKLTQAIRASHPEHRKLRFQIKSSQEEVEQANNFVPVQDPMSSPSEVDFKPIEEPGVMIDPEFSAGRPFTSRPEPEAPYGAIIPDTMIMYDEPVVFYPTDAFQGLDPQLALLDPMPFTMEQASELNVQPRSFLLKRKLRESPEHHKGRPDVTDDGPVGKPNRPPPRPARPPSPPSPPRPPSPPHHHHEDDDESVDDSVPRDDHHHHHHHPPPPPPPEQSYLEDTFFPGALGFGATGDMCMFQNVQNLSPSCTQAIGDVYVLRQQYWNSYSEAQDASHHHHPFFGLVFVVVVLALFVKRVMMTPRRRQVNKFLMALNEHPELKAQLSTQLNMEIPQPRRATCCGGSRQTFFQRLCFAVSFILFAFFAGLFIAITSLELTAHIVNGMEAHQQAARDDDSDEYSGHPVSNLTVLLILTVIFVAQLLILRFIMRSASRMYRSLCGSPSMEEEDRSDSQSSHGQGGMQVELQRMAALPVSFYREYVSPRVSSFFATRAATSDGYAPLNAGGMDEQEMTSVRSARPTVVPVTSASPQHYAVYTGIPVNSQQVMQVTARPISAVSLV